MQHNETTGGGEGPDGADRWIGVVASRFNRPFCEGLLAACLEELKRLGVADTGIEVVRVPGALEIPLALQALANSGRFNALVALGVVIRGETYHFEIVANESCRGVMEVQLDTGVPIANGILTCNDEDQVKARMYEKALDCARAAVEMSRLLDKLNGISA